MLKISDLEKLPQRWKSKEMAEKLGVSQATLARWRKLGIGPPYKRQGANISYFADELEIWLEANLRNI